LSEQGDRSPLECFETTCIIACSQALFSKSTQNLLWTGKFNDPTGRT
jgi:hypothetical protein